MTETVWDRTGYAAPESLTPGVIERLRAIVGERHVLTSSDDVGAHSLDIGLWSTRGAAVVFPASADEIAQLLRVEVAKSCPESDERRPRRLRLQAGDALDGVPHRQVAALEQ